MQRIIGDDVAEDLHGSGKDGFTSGDPGVAGATVVTAAFLNEVQESIVRIIEAAGLTPSTSHTQLLDAIFNGDIDFDNITTTGAVSAVTVTASSEVSGASVASSTGDVTSARDVIAERDFLFDDAQEKTFRLSPVVFAGQAGVTYDAGTDVASITGSPVRVQLNGVLPDGAIVKQVRMAVTKANTNPTQMIVERRVVDFTPSFSGDVVSQAGADSQTTSGDLVLTTGDISADADSVLDTGLAISSVRFIPATAAADEVRAIEVTYLVTKIGKV